MLIEQERIGEMLKRTTDQLSELRKRSAASLEEKIQKELSDLMFDNAKVSIEITRMDKYTANGIDRAEFLISTNVGEPLKPLAKIASGGEASRFMLGLKRVTADLEGTDVLVFDEIDTGISGKIAMVVAEKLSDISFGHQVIAVTHLPQLTAMADANFLIEKSESDFRTHTDIKRLNEEECLSELSRLQGSVGPDELSYRNALELKNWANSYKKSRKR